MWENSAQSLDHSFHYSKLSCWKPIYTVHIVAAYIIFLSGLAAMISRLYSRLYFLHIWFGRIYIISMLWGTFSSLLIHNTGLPIGVIYSFFWVGGGLSVGLILITFHQKRVFKRRNAQKVTPDPDVSPFVAKFKDIMGRMFSLKGLHGCIMFVSWINIAGRVFVTPPVQDFECYTYPAFKQVNTKYHNYTVGEPVTFVPQVDPNYKRMPWAGWEEGWLVVMFVGPYIAAFLFGVVFLSITLRTSRKEPVPTKEPLQAEAIEQ
ncbi:hypothetical protein HK098_004546 [Nowakowskiella sp. JEL0407]|nr:hypothetical protein HK098_004546 [Nowakowskiella sp. JEL0407]